MAAPRLLPDKTTLARLRRSGKTYAEIADEYGVTETAVYLRLKADGLVTDRKVSHKELIPWQVRGIHAHAHPALMLRTLSRRVQGLENPASRERMLDRWLAELKAANVVVCYDPDMPENDASPKTGGWYYMRRRKSDGNDLIRVTKPGEDLHRVKR